MVFHVRITLNEVVKQTSRAPIAIGETVLIDKEGKQVVLTSGIQRNYNEISYSLQDEEEEKVKKETEKKKASADSGFDNDDEDEILKQSKTGVIVESRL